MDIQQFEREYCERSGYTVTAMHERGRFAVRCPCGLDECPGFQMISAGMFEFFVQDELWRLDA